jgi:hypothetical protein
MTDKFQYESLVDEALRGVVRRVLTHAADRGLPGTHHFYISFRTNETGVEMPDYLRTKYPDEMTIVLQHQYWGLEVTDEAFEVTVSFNKRNERLKAALVGPAPAGGETNAADDAHSPAAAETKGAPAAEGEEKTADGKEGGAKVVTLDAFRKKP